jgi:hypothetical protein
LEFGLALPLSSGPQHGPAPERNEDDLLRKKARGTTSPTPRSATQTNITLRSNLAPKEDWRANMADWKTVVKGGGHPFLVRVLTSFRSSSCSSGTTICHAADVDARYTSSEPKVQTISVGSTAAQKFERRLHSAAAHSALFYTWGYNRLPNVPELLRASRAQDSSRAAASRVQEKRLKVCFLAPFHRNEPCPICTVPSKPSRL